MENNVNRPLTNPVLTGLFKRRREIDPSDKEAMAECMSRIAEEVVTKAHFLSVVKMENGNFEPDESGNVVLEENARITFPMLNGPENKPYFPVFTDWEQLREWEPCKEADVDTLILTFDDYYAMVEDNENGVVINPFSDNIIFTNAHMHHFKEVKELNATGRSEHVITERTEVMIGEPEQYPTEMTDAVIKYAKKMKNINAIWLKLMMDGTEKSFLLTVDFTGDRAATFDGIASVARPYIPYGMFINMISAGEPTAESIVKDKPFYKRKRGLFG